MKSIKISISAFLLVAFCLFQSNVIAQESEQTPYWYVTYQKVQWSRVDSLQKLITKYTVPIVAQAKKNGSILDFKILIHHTGSANNVVRMIKYPSWAAINEGPGFQKAFEEIEPDKAKRDAANESFSWVFEGSTHTDTIYTDAMDDQE